MNTGFELPHGREQHEELLSDPVVPAGAKTERGDATAHSGNGRPTKFMLRSGDGISVVLRLS